MGSLVAAGRLRRVIRLHSGDFIEYFGGGLGWEAVFLNGEPVSLKESPLWFAREFDFEYRGVPAQVEVSVGPLFKIREFRLSIDSQVVYRDPPWGPPSLLVNASAITPPARNVPETQIGHSFWVWLGLIVVTSVVTGLVRGFLF